MGLKSNHPKIEPIALVSHKWLVAIIERHVMRKYTDIEKMNLRFNIMV